MDSIYILKIDVKGKKVEDKSYTRRCHWRIESYRNEWFEQNIDCPCGRCEINFTVTNGIACMFDGVEYELFEIISWLN